jgi:hypothetical protein
LCKVFVMWRLIYCGKDRNYGTIDSKSSMEIIALEGMLTLQRINVLCVVDYSRRLILNKRMEFYIHRELIDEIIFDPKIVKQY